MEIYDIYRNRYDPYLRPSSRNSHLLNMIQHKSSPPVYEDNSEQILDLSRRCDSVETRKTPSPYTSPSSSFGTNSPSTHCSSPATTSLLTPPNNSILFENHGKSLLMPAYPLYNSSTATTIKREKSPILSLPIKNVNHQKQSAQTKTLNPIELIKPILESNNTTLLRDVKSPNATLTTEGLTDSIPLATSSTVPLILPKILSADGKPTRPFKAYPRDPLVIAANFAATDVLYDGPRVERYTEYRKRVLEQIRSANGGHRTITNPKMRRANSRNRNSIDSHHTNDKNESIMSSNSCGESSDERCAESSDNDATSSTPTASSTTATISGTCNNNNNNNNNNPTVPNQNGSVKDAAYYERRRKNNAAAKKSRDRRRIKEDEIAIRAAYLERQNIELLCQLDALKAQLASLTKSAC